ncbi:MAG: efflux RND transporter periplasmic adaptor subunit, partial [Parachlamydiaceae bacterium]
MKNKFFLFSLLILVFLASLYIIATFQKMVPTTTVAKNPNLKTEPYRIYGLIEPENRAVYINPPMTKRIDRLFKVAGDPVKVGEPLVQLDNEIEKARVETLKAELEARKAALKINLDRVERNRKLIPANVIDEFEYKQSELDYDLTKAQVEVAEKNLLAAQAELDRLLL